jgi:hypothetical protein
VGTPDGHPPARDGPRPLDVLRPGPPAGGDGRG